MNKIRARFTAMGDRSKFSRGEAKPLQLLAWHYYRLSNSHVQNRTVLWMGWENVLLRTAVLPID